MAEKCHKRIRIQKMLNHIGGADTIKLLLEILTRIFKIHRNKSKIRKRAFDRFLHRRLVYDGNIRSYGMNKILDFLGITASNIEVRRICRFPQDLACFLVHVVLIDPGSGYSSLSPIIRAVFNKRASVRARHIISPNTKVLKAQVTHEKVLLYSLKAIITYQNARGNP